MELPEGLTSRPFEMSDLDEVYRVGATYEIEMTGEPGIDKAGIESYWLMPSFHLESDSVGVFDGLTLVAYGQVIMDKYIDVCVHPDHRGRGLGSALAQWSEHRLRDAGSTKAFQVAPVADTAAHELFAARGYDKAWTSWVLEFPKGVLIPNRELAEGYVVRPFRAGVEDVAVYELVQTAFGEWPERTRTTYEDWRAVVFDRQGFGPDKLLVATYADEVVGVCYVIDGESSGWVQNIAVDKAHRHRGIAQVLLAKAFEGTRSRGLERAELMTDSRTGALSLYENLGMRITQTHQDWSLELASLLQDLADF